MIDNKWNVILVMKMKKIIHIIQKSHIIKEECIEKDIMIYLKVIISMDMETKTIIESMFQ